mmetsp:Transcript_12059/g.24494  ORF Transcript_12059/g.24494 Transcript_12059/m.24494 type:complete len:95 (-) Transcript_12059:94-378(-)
MMSSSEVPSSSLPSSSQTTMSDEEEGFPFDEAFTGGGGRKSSEKPNESNNDDVSALMTIKQFYQQIEQLNSGAIKKNSEPLKVFRIELHGDLRG